MRALPQLAARRLRALPPAPPQAWAWEREARPDQLPPPGDWAVWLALAGRGWGKTRTGAEWCNRLAHDDPGCRIALVGRTDDDVRKTMIEGESGILEKSPTFFRAEYKAGLATVVWPNGSMGFRYSSEEPDRLRGPQHHYAWADEPAAWRRPKETWSNLRMGLRLGRRPRIFASTTPRPTAEVKALLKDPSTVVVRGTTYDNAANLPSAFLDEVKRLYEGTRLGRQELLGEVLDDAPGALWKRAWVDDHRVTPADLPALAHLVVAVDPSVSAGEGSAECGLVVFGLSAAGHGYLVHDGSERMPSEVWAARVVDLWDLHRCDLVVAEVNQGGDLVESVVTTAAAGRGLHLPVQKVHASRGKRTRAEPVALLYQKGWVHHVGTYPELEDQLCGWDPGSGDDSPDRLDALVWGATYYLPRFRGADRAKPPEPPRQGTPEWCEAEERRLEQEDDEWQERQERRRRGRGR